MAHQHGGKELSPEEEAKIAMRALEEHDFAHALHHAGAALAGDPRRIEFKALLDRILDAMDDPVGVLAGKNDFMNAAVRAYALEKKGRALEALHLILSVCVARPDIPYLSWARAWAEKPGVIAPRADEAERHVVAPLMELVVKMPGEPPESDPRHALLVDAAAICAVLREACPRSEKVVSVSVSTLRRLGKRREALAIAERAFQSGPSWLTAMSLGSARRDIGDADGAIRAYRVCLEHKPDDLVPCLDIGDILLDGGRLDEARREYERLLVDEPLHDWALPSVAYVRAAQGDAAAESQLFALADAGNRRASDLAARLRTRGARSS